MLVVMAMQILTRLVDTHWPDVISWTAMAGTLALAGRSIRRREAYLLTLCAIAALALLRLHADPPAAFAAALGQGAFLMAFILFLGLLYEAAVTSPSIAKVGPWLTGQPPGRRYVALFTGTGILAVLFNAGILSVLVPLVQRSTRHAAPDAPQAALRERRQMTAILRGFAWSVVWSPTALAPLLMADLVPAIDRKAWMAYGLVVFVLVLGLGALEDRLRVRRRVAETLEPGEPLSRDAAAGLVGASGALIAIALGTMWLTGESMAFGLMIACPLMLVGWTALQNGPAPCGRAATRQRLADVVGGLPDTLPLAITLASAGIFGRSAAELLPAVGLSDALGVAEVPDAALLATIPPVLALVSLTGISPIMMAVFLGSMLGGMATLPADPTLLALSISCGWALAMIFSPLSTPALLLNRISAVPALTLTWRWNLLFSLIVVLGLPFIFVLLVL